MFSGVPPLSYCHAGSTDAIDIYLFITLLKALSEVGTYRQSRKLDRPN